ncbi:MAG: hypothetical protein JW993_10170 [Sedimentisphaerales bacterium]|nr:hypothetical protein [Sedimentisphaerales bacterium]
MNEQRILDELLALLEGTGVKVRREAMGGRGGGLCAVKGEHIFFLDTESASAETAALCAQAITRLMDIEAVYVRPEVRQFIEGHAGSVT